MNVELDRREAELLIAVLTYAEREAALSVNEPMVKALEALRPWRSALLQGYIRHMVKA